MEMGPVAIILNSKQSRLLCSFCLPIERMRKAGDTSRPCYLEESPSYLQNRVPRSSKQSTNMSSATRKNRVPSSSLRPTQDRAPGENGHCRTPKQQNRAQQEHTTTATEQSTTRRHTNRSGVHARTEELEEGAQGRRPRPPTDDSVRKRKAARVDGAATGCAGGWCTDSLDERPGSARVKIRADDDDTRMAR